ncbi:hypothetical protein TcWFU_007011 [Taenia crassiceps]|uniref:Uncharacterized protein n=1 Tax=Taenia crassiceps TaxID=6207 RepID=A0ABR4QHS8_9CEST
MSSISPPPGRLKVGWVGGGGGRGVIGKAGVEGKLDSSLPPKGSQVAIFGVCFHYVFGVGAVPVTHSQCRRFDQALKKEPIRKDKAAP